MLSLRRISARMRTPQERTALLLSRSCRPLIRSLSSSTADEATASAQRVGRWSLRLAHDNTFLSYHRNAIIATVAGGSLIQYRVNQDRPPLAGACLLGMGGLYMYVGSGLYVWQVWKLRVPLKLGKWTIFWALFNASWPLTLWSVALACLLEEPPKVLLNGLRLIEHRLPNMLHASLFLDPPALYPVCVLLRAVMRHEESRLVTVRSRGAGTSNDGTHRSARLRPYTTRAGPLTDDDVATIITRRMERLHALQAKIDEMARSKTAVPTALIAPVLDTLNSELEMLEKVLQVDTGAGTQLELQWWLTRLYSSPRRKLLDELETVQTLLRRIDAVKFTSAHYAASIATR